MYHISKNCPYGFPDAATYIGIINHALHPLPTTVSTTLTPAVTITTTPVAVPSSGNNRPHNKGPTQPVAAVGSWADETAATFPSASSALGGGSDTEDDKTDEVSAPFHAPHLWWKACISGPGTLLPVTMPMLLDNDTHIVLIHTDLVMKLGLCHHLLPKPETVDVAVKPSDTLSCTTPTKGVKLSVTSLDGQWTSRTVCTLVAPHLCILIILGLLFLSHNFIVTNHAA